ncbi:MAG: dihydrofolate reductase, partial [Thermotaleaceae bacterium]
MGKRTFDEIKNIENISSLYPTTKNYAFTYAERLLVREFIPMNCDVVEFLRQIESNKNICPSR